MRGLSPKPNTYEELYYILALQKEEVTDVKKTLAIIAAIVESKDLQKYIDDWLSMALPDNKAEVQSSVEHLKAVWDHYKNTVFHPYGGANSVNTK